MLAALGAKPARPESQLGSEALKLCHGSGEHLGNPAVMPRPTRYFRREQLQQAEEVVVVTCKPSMDDRLVMCNAVPQRAQPV